MSTVGSLKGMCRVRSLNSFSQAVFTYSCVAPEQVHILRWCRSEVVDRIPTRIHLGSYLQNSDISKWSRGDSNP